MNANFQKIAGFCCALWISLSARGAAGLVNQQITLQPGWNAIWLEVNPVNESPSAVFTGVEVDSVWGWSARRTTASFIADAAEPVWNQDAMLMFVSTNREDSFQNNLHAIQAQRPYLVKLRGSAAATLTVAGTPSTDLPEWTPDVFNLRGFPVEAAAPPTFLNFFKWSAAHYSAATGQLESIYTLNALGNWTLVAPGDLMRSGAAYWVRCRGASRFVAPLEPSVPGLQALDFDLNLPEIGLVLLNRRTTAATAVISGLNVGAGAFSQAMVSPTNGLGFSAINGPVSKLLAAGEVATTALRINRAQLPSDDFGGVATVTDGQGTRFWIPLGAKRLTVPDTGDPILREAKARAGLWVGYVSLEGVSEAHSGPLATLLVTNQSGLIHEEKVRVGIGEIPTPVATPFTMKFLLHVDTNGVTRLLKEVAMMYSEGTFTNDVDGTKVQDQKARYVLLTEDSLIPLYTGAVSAGGKQVGRRVSTADFDFPTTPGNNFLPLTGAFAVSNTLSATITLGSSFPTNPFRHKFHPDHDNLEADFVTTARRTEVYQVSRAIQITPTATDPSGKSPPGYGDTTFGGNYREVISGLHKADVVIAGTFSLRRVSQIGMLNQ